MIERVPHAVGHRFCPLLELLPIARVASNEFLLDPVAPHGAPLVVVSSKPEFRDARKAMILRNLFWIEVAMVVDDGQMGCVIVIEGLCSSRLLQEIFVHEGFHLVRYYIS